MVCFLSVIFVFVASYLISFGVAWLFGGSDEVIRAVVQFPVFAICFATFAVMGQPQSALWKVFVKVS